MFSPEIQVVAWRLMVGALLLKLDQLQNVLSSTSVNKLYKHLSDTYVRTTTTHISFFVS